MHQRLLGQSIGVRQKVVSDVVAGFFLKRATAFSGSVIEVEDHVRNGRIIKLPELFFRGKFYLPTADYPSSFKWQVPFISKIELKHAAIVLAWAGSDGCDWHVAGTETGSSFHKPSSSDYVCISSSPVLVLMRVVFFNNRSEQFTVV